MELDTNKIDNATLGLLCLGLGGEYDNMARTSGGKEHRGKHRTMEPKAQRVGPRAANQVLVPGR